MKNEDESKNYRAEIEQIINVLADKFDINKEQRGKQINGQLLHRGSQWAEVRPGRVD